MRKIGEKVVGIILVIVCVSLLTACPGPEPQEETINVVVLSGGGRANNGATDIAIGRDYIHLTANRSGHLSVISIEGESQLIFSTEFPARISGLSQANWERVVESNVNDVIAMGSNLRASTEEANILCALARASRALKSLEVDRKHLIVIDSGLQTKGAFSFVEILLESVDADMLTKRLREKRAIPCLQNVHVTWIGLGDTVLPQESLTPLNRNMLQEVWESILVAAGASSIEFRDDLPILPEVDRSLPWVTPVEIFRSEIYLEDESEYPVAEEPVVEEPVVLEDVVVLDGRRLNFMPNTADLISDRNVVREYIRPIIDYLIANPEYEIFLVGTTASPGTEEGRINLASARGRIVEQIMVESGVNQNQIRVIGLGHGNGFTIDDTNAQGELVESIAFRNRQVLIMSTNSKEAEILIDR